MGDKINKFKRKKIKGNKMGKRKEKEKNLTVEIAMRLFYVSFRDESSKISQYSFIFQIRSIVGESVLNRRTGRGGVIQYNFS